VKRVWVVGALVVIAFTGCSTAHGRRGTAERRAAELLQRVVVPPDATSYSGTLPTPLREASFKPDTPNLVDVHRVWLVPEPMNRVLAFERAHLPKGFVVSGNGQSGRLDSAAPQSKFLSFMVNTPLPPNGPIESENLVVTFAPRTKTTTFVRVDAQAIWQPARDRATIVPAGDRVITIVTDGHRRAITDAGKVRRIERAFNALPEEVPGSGSCPPNAPLTVTFAPTRTAQPDITATVQCAVVLAVTAHGHHGFLIDREGIAALLECPASAGARAVPLELCPDPVGQ
jgi:hypothetical protein